MAVNIDFESLARISKCGKPDAIKAAAEKCFEYREGGLPPEDVAEYKETLEATAEQVEAVCIISTLLEFSSFP